MKYHSAENVAIIHTLSEMPLKFELTAILNTKEKIPYIEFF